MKKIILGFFVSLIASSALQAQITIIPKLGSSYATVALSDNIKNDFTPYTDYGYKIGFILGAAVEFPIVGDKLFLQPELLFHQKGWEETTDYFGLYESSYTLNYLELPVLFKYKLGNFYLNAGPSIAFGIGGKYKESYSYQGFSEDYDGKIKFGDEPDFYEGDDYYIDNGLDFGAQFGAGVKAGPIIIDLRFGMGLSNLYDKPDGLSGDWKNQNRSFQLTVAYPILIGN
ncbi:MAG: PorT family protein [Cyclobacteriaceae bacterium]|nr:PorT family protein [Cyclobacteriaceae bacterium]